MWDIARRSWPERGQGGQSSYLPAGRCNLGICPVIGPRRLPWRWRRAGDWQEITERSLQAGPRDGIHVRVPRGQCTCHRARRMGGRSREDRCHRCRRSRNSWLEGGDDHVFPTGAITGFPSRGGWAGCSVRGVPFVVLCVQRVFRPLLDGGPRWRGGRSRWSMSPRSWSTGMRDGRSW